VEPGDPDALARAIEQMVRDLPADRRREPRHQELVERYSHESCRKTLQKELYRIAARKPIDRT